MALTEHERILIKRSTTAGVVPTIPISNDHTDGTWLATDIYKGEVFINQADHKVYSRGDNGIFRIDQNLTEDDLLTSPNLFVSATDGNNTTGDGSVNKPFQTLQKAISMVRASQTIVVFGGLYNNNDGATYSNPTNNVVKNLLQTISSTTVLATYVITVADTSILSVGMSVSGTGIASNTFITAINSATTYTINNAATASGTVSLNYNGYYTIFCFPGVTINQTSGSFYDSHTVAGRVDIYGSPNIVTDTMTGTTAIKIREICTLNIGKMQSYTTAIHAYSRGTDLGNTTVQSLESMIINVKEISFIDQANAAVKFTNAQSGNVVGNGTIIFSCGTIEYKSGLSPTGAEYIEVDNPYTLSIINTTAMFRGAGTSSNTTIVNVVGIPSEFSIDNMSVRMGGGGASGTKVIQLNAITLLKNLFRNIYCSVSDVTFLTGSIANAVNAENIYLVNGSTMVSGSVTVKTVAPNTADTRTYISNLSNIATIFTRS